MRRLVVAVALLATVTAGCSRERADRAAPKAEAEAASPDADADTDVDAAPEADPGAVTDGDPAGDGSDVTTMADAFSAQTTEPPPTAAFEIRLGGAVSGSGTGEVEARCVQGPGFLDVAVTADPPLRVGAFAMTSLVLSAPGHRGPGTYRVGGPDGEWSISLVEVESDTPFDFVAPLEGASGTLTVESGDKGTFDVRGLLDQDERAISLAGRFACGRVER